MKLTRSIPAALPITLLASVLVALPTARAGPPEGNGIVEPRTLLCPNTITGGIYIAGCLPSVNPPASKIDQRGLNQVPLLYGIPCTGSNFGKCIGLSRLPSATPY